MYAHRGEKDCLPRYYLPQRTVLLAVARRVSVRDADALPCVEEKSREEMEIVPLHVARLPGVVRRRWRHACALVFEAPEDVS